jgi:hypothetical protein
MHAHIPGNDQFSSDSIGHERLIEQRGLEGLFTDVAAGADGIPVLSELSPVIGLECAVKWQVRGNRQFRILP